LEVTSTAGRRQRSSQLELPVGDGAALLGIPALDPEQTHEELFVVPTERRAVIPVGPARSVRGDAVGLLRREVRWTEVEQLYVHPRTVRLDAGAPGLLRDLEGEVTHDVTNSDVAFHALRGYVPGDDRRFIHWRTSARTGTLMVRQFEQTRRSHTLLALSTGAGDYAGDDQFELAVEAAASIGLQAFRETRPVSLVTSQHTLPARTARTMLDQFSGVDPTPRDHGVGPMARRAVREIPEASIAFVFCGSNPSPAEIRSAGLAFPVGVRVVAVRAVPAAQSGVRILAGVPVVTLGALDELALSLLRAGAA
jgi:uncharacterized protein (DUF58 family)